MLGSAQDARGGAALHDPARAHDDQLVGQRLDDAEIVADEEVGEAVANLQLAEEIDDLGLHRYVEGRGRLVEDDQLRAKDDGARDGDALALAARELMRVAVAGGGIEAHLEQDLVHEGAALLAARLDA